MRQDIEASVIGGLLIGGLTPTASDVLATLEPEAFSIPLYRKAFEVIRKQARNRNLIDALMVAEACGEEHFTSILMTSKNCPSAANLKGYAGMVADNYHRRLVLEIMDEMREPIQSGTIDASSQAMDELVKRLSAIRKPRDEVKPVRLGEIITDYTDTLDRRLRNGEESDTLKTGIDELDAITGGMNAEDLVIIAARPGMGKTELALKIAEGVASRVIPGSDVRRGVLIFSMEMSALQIAERSIANAGRMSVSVLRNPASMDDEGWARVANGMSQLADLDVWVVDASRLSVEEIRSIAERHKQENPNLSLIMADYLGLIEKPKADRNDLAIAHISGSLKAMAKDLKTPVISLSQLSRDVEKRPNKRPTNADLRDSGSIEQDADSIIMLYREWFHPAFANQWWCSPECGTKIALERRSKEHEKAEKAAEKKRRREEQKQKDKLKIRKLALKPRSYWIKQAQQAVNAFIRERDRDLPCISCGTLTSAQWDAGHYRTTAAAPQLRFDERNIHKQCVVCNQHKSGNLVPYRVELINRIGQEAVDEIESNHNRHRWTIEECKAIKAEYQQKLKDLRNSRSEAA